MPQKGKKNYQSCNATDRILFFIWKWEGYAELLQHQQLQIKAHITLNENLQSSGEQVYFNMYQARSNCPLSGVAADDFDHSNRFGTRIYFNIVDLCGILPYKRMYPYKCGIKINFYNLTTQKDQ